VNRYGRTGEHRPGGFFVAAGPGLPAGRLTRVVSVLDFAPTLLALLGVPAPAGDGRAIAELLG
jgi:predicted AlkP superfamily phosphohydrolase/phosphomutase